MNRREILGLAAAALGSSPPSAAGGVPPESCRLLLVLFGGGARRSETMGDPQRRHIPFLAKELLPRGTLWTDARVEGRVVHPNCNAAIKTGHWEYDDLDWSKPPAHPTIFEIVRKARRLPDTAAWTFVYASILAKTGTSSAADHGDRWAANVVEPPTIPRETADRMEQLLAQARASGSEEAELAAAAACARLARSASRATLDGLRSPAARTWFDGQYGKWREGAGTTSHDAFLADCAIDCMKTFSPDVLSVDFGEIDCAHYGSWSRYVEAIQRTDALVGRLWRALQALDGYRGRTRMVVLPDHGRQLEGPGSPGFIHHSDFYTNEGADEGCRRVWMLAVGPGVAAGRTIDRPTPITAAASIGLEGLGLRPARETR